VQIINKPEANGSNVPAWPTLGILIRLRIFLTASKEVQLSGLLINKTFPEANSLTGCIKANVSVEFFVC
jgi:hypothetical protein